MIKRLGKRKEKREASGRKKRRKKGENVFACEANQRVRDTRRREESK